MKKILLLLLRKQLNKSDRTFRLNVCKEIHRYYDEEFNEQTSFGRYYWAIGDMIKAGNENITLNEDYDVAGGIMSEFEETKHFLKKEKLNKPRRNKLKRILGSNYL